MESKNLNKPDTYQWQPGNLVWVEHEGLKGGFAISDIGIIYTIYSNEPDFQVGVLLRSGRIIRTPVITDKVTFLKSTNSIYAFTGIDQLRQDYKAGQFDVFFTEVINH